MDFFSLDVEGGELDVLTMIDFDNFSSGLQLSKLTKGNSKRETRLQSYLPNLVTLRAIGSTMIGV